jgi:hypothetical protein
MTTMMHVHNYLYSHHHISKKEMSAPFKSFFAKATSMLALPAISSKRTPFTFASVTKDQLIRKASWGDGLVMLRPPMAFTYEAELADAFVEGSPGGAELGGMVYDRWATLGPMASTDFFGDIPARGGGKGSLRVVHAGKRLLAIPTKWSGGFQCFLTDTLPRLVYVLDALQADPEAKVLLEGTSIQMQFMAMLGLASRVVKFSPDLNIAYTADVLSGKKS